ncbi:MAG: hypothetical protein ACREHC_02130 [Candidatus Levyibacteriota bacterium]
MSKQTTFNFIGHSWSPEIGEASFSYKIEHNGETFNLTEKLFFPLENQSKNIPLALLTNTLDALSLAIGISYYKLFCPREIKLANMTLTHKQADFWNIVYTKGLGEFYYKNRIDFRDKVHFPFAEKDSALPISFPRRDRSLVGIGGGKDSVVSAEMLKRVGKPFANYILNPHPLQLEVSKVIGGDILPVKRELDPQIFALNKREDTYNGHIPVSSIYALVGVFLAIVYDYRFVVVSNEHSSNYGNVMYLAMEINHQWSKSLEFESMLQEYIYKFITPDVTYFSLLRQKSELGIVKKFVKNPEYFAHFSSCNRNFKLNSQGAMVKWCGECAKCAFAFVMLAAFLSAEQVADIFGKNLLDDETLLKTYKELLGLEAIKPFDCVGTPEEVRTAFYLIRERGSFKNSPVMRWFEEQIMPRFPDSKTLRSRLLNPSEEHHIPTVFQEALQ